MPWIHFHVGSRGQVNACCVANIPYGNINTHSLNQIWHGDAINEVRSQFLSGEPDQRCHNCIQKETAGAKSIRQETLEKFPAFQALKETPSQPIYFDIRFSNVCNFRCRTCWHGASSKWFADAKLLGNNSGEKAIIKNIDDFEDFLSKSSNALLSAEEFYFAGGEPLFTEEHYLLLEWLIANRATKARLRYNTNFSKLKFKHYDILELWKHFPQVEILASIDASEDLGEYIRKEMKWQEILTNREAIRALPHLTFKLSPTISVFNVEHLPTLYKQAVHLNLISPEDLYINILEYPAYYNIQILPAHKKQKVREVYQQFFTWLSENNLPENISKTFQDILQYMDQPTPLSTTKQEKLWKQFQMQTAKLDDIRGESVLDFI